MLKPGRDLDLALEALPLHCAGHLLRQHLHHDLPTEILFLGQKQTAHASGSKLTLEGVRSAKGLVERVAEVISHGGAYRAFSENSSRFPVESVVYLEPAC